MNGLDKMNNYCACWSIGSIHLIIGPMFSGKTTELFRLVRRHKLAGKEVVVVKSSKDNRFDKVQACTHDMNKMEAITSYDIASIHEELKRYDVIGIDEGQFFEDIAYFAEKLANSGRTVIIAALNGDYRQKSFQTVTSLFSISDKIEKLSAVCHTCGHSASFTYRISESTELEVIGGKEAYLAVCRSCLIIKTNRKGNDIQKSKKRRTTEIKLSNDEELKIANFRGNECNA